jgi:hypothetical protein
VRAAIIIAVMLAEKSADAVGAKIRHAVLAGPGQDDRVRENDFMLIDAALEVAQDIVSTGNMIAEVCPTMSTKSLRLDVFGRDGGWREGGVCT